MPIVEIHGLEKTYTTRKEKIRALRGIDLQVKEGTVQGVLGPNGAGKTTLTKSLTTIEKPTKGHAKIAGLDVVKDARKVRQIIGVSAQSSTVDDRLTATENLEVNGRLYHLSSKSTQLRTQELLEKFSLQEAAKRPVKGFSGGMRRRLDLACALVAEPKVLFLDEPTTGLDPTSRIALWNIIKERVAGGTTVFLTTQYLDEADKLADDIVVINKGKIIAQGNADELKAQAGGHSVHISLVNEDDVDSATRILEKYGTSKAHVSDRNLRVSTTAGVKALSNILLALEQEDIKIHDGSIQRPTLDDVFIHLTGDTTQTEGAK